MDTSTSLKRQMARNTNAIFNFAQVSLTIAGLTLVILFFNRHIEQHAVVATTFKAQIPVATTESEPQAAAPALETLTPRMRAALGDVSRRYRVSAAALEPIFEAAQLTGRKLSLDPLLIIAVIGIESRFNPLSESSSGAQGLMQIVPRFHRDKLPEGAGKLPFFDPLVNVGVGAQVLKESIRRNGGLVAGLQQFAGSSDDEEQAYATKVMAEKQRLEQAPRRGTENEA